jgi:hypothetical protein
MILLLAIVLVLAAPVLYYVYGYLQAKKQLSNIPLVKSYILPWQLLTSDDKLSFMKFPWKQWHIARKTDNIWRFVAGKLTILVTN